ncbi:MAG: VWA domain-containing protein [Verrucomicrobiaceae bacterium]|nr:VWA domain-containing protein [Verrucomicrobiaceae bacterium]
MNTRTHSTASCFPFVLKTAVLAAALAWMHPPARGEILNEEIITTDLSYHILYYTTDSSNTDWFTLDSDAQTIASFYDPDGAGTGIHENYVSLGFREPDFGVFGSRVLLRTAPLTGGRSNALFPDRIVLPPVSLNAMTFTDKKELCAHELHHIVQYQYVPWGLNFLDLYPFGIEGTATAAENCISADVDANTNLDYNNPLYPTLVDYYMWNESDDYLWTGSGYHSGLFWTYLMEQFGSARTEPGFGVDVLQRFYELADAHHDEGVTDLIDRVLGEKDRKTTSAFDTGVDVREVFQDFTIANWLASRSPLLSVSDPARFTYVDNMPAAASSPSSTTHGTLAKGANTGMQTSSVERYAARYLECNFSLTAPSDSYGVGFWAQSQASNKNWFSIIGKRHSGQIDFIQKSSVHPDENNPFQYAVMQSATDPYETFYVVANGDETDYPSLLADFDYYFSYFQPTLDIQEPTAAYLAYVGDGTAPERFLVRLRVTSPDYLGSGSMNGLTASHFTVYVGSTTVSSNLAPVLSAAYVLGEYWLTCQAPVKSPAPVGAQNITVQLGGVSDTEQEAVLYEHLEVDQMIVIDRSGSMSATSGGVRRVDGARAAAQLFVDTSGSDDQIGIVRFSGDGTEPDSTSYGDGQVMYSLQKMNSQFERDLVNLLIDTTNPAGDVLTPTGSTSIGDGLYHGAKEIVDHGQSGAQKWIILLSDGVQNEDSKYSDQKAFLTGLGVHVETVALGSGADNGLLQSIATETSGKYYEVAAPTDPPFAPPIGKGGAPANLGPGGSGTMLMELANTFLVSSERIHRRERILEASGSLAAGASTSPTLTLTEGGLTDCVVTAFGETSGKIGLTITRPDSTTVPAPDAGYTSTTLDPSGHYWDPGYYVSYRIPSMTDGMWTFSVSNSGTASLNYLLVVSGKNRQGAAVRLCFAEYHGNSTLYAQNGLYLRGLPMPVVAMITDGTGPIRGATVTAVVTHPTRGPVTLRLRDDGNGNDGVANDGVYSAIYRPTTEASFSGMNNAEGSPATVKPSYQVTVVATGKDNLSRNFQRVTRGSFQVFETQEGGDTDGDGMPDRYEALHAGINASVADATGDIDGDGLTNFQEYQLGTDPARIDTDGGGESDFSENSRGGNPVDYTDDLIKQPLVARVLDRWGDLRPPEAETAWIPKPGQNIVTFSVERGFHDVEIRRSTSASGPFALITTVHADVDGGIYIDTGLTNGTTYYYYVQPLDAAGHRGAASRVFSGTPRTDVDYPSGTLSINGGSRYITSTTVNLQFNVSPDVTQMKIGGSANLSALPWVAFSSSVAGWSLGAPPPSGTRRNVFALVRDAAGNETLLSASATFVAPAAAATVTGTAVTSLDSNNRNINVRLKSGASVNEIHTGPSGAFALPVPAGTWDISISQRGYQPFLLNGVVLAAASTLNLGTINLTPIDSDGDSLLDVPELRTYNTNRHRPDTDGDGQSDGAEILLLFTDPLDPNSLLRATGTPVVNTSAGTITITFASVSGVTYGFETSTDLASWSTVMSSGTPYKVTATGPVTTATLGFTPGTSKLFVRITFP